MNKTTVTSKMKQECGGFPMYCRTIKMLSLWIGLIAMSGSFWMPQTAWGHDPLPEYNQIAAFSQGEPFENDGANYVLLPDLKAQFTASLNASNPARTTPASADEIQSHIDAITVLEHKGPYTIFKRETETASPSRLRGDSPEATPTCPVVLNLNTRSLGILTGRLWLKLENLQHAPFLADEYDMLLSFINDAMSTAFYEAPDQDLLVLRHKLANDGRVLHVTLDMVDRIRRPRSH